MPSEGPPETLDANGLPSLVGCSLRSALIGARRTLVVPSGLVGGRRGSFSLDIEASLVAGTLEEEEAESADAGRAELCVGSLVESGLRTEAAEDDVDGVATTA